jgi:hypothetical protein
MSTTIEHMSDRHVLEVESGGAAVEAFGGLAVVVLSILGLVGLASVPLASIAGIVFGIALLAQGAAVAAEYSDLFSRLSGGTMGAIELGGGMTVEITAGGAAIVLGILALLGDASAYLLPALVITGGASLILTTGTLQRLNHLKMAAAEASDMAERVMRATTSSAAAGQLLLGVAAIVLGIVAFSVTPTAMVAGAAQLTGTRMILTLVGLLVIGSSITMSGGALVGRLTQMFDRRTASRRQPQQP